MWHRHLGCSWSLLDSILAISVCCLLQVNAATSSALILEDLLNDTEPQQPIGHVDSHDTARMTDDDNTLRGCECWRWPECVSNCTVNPILQAQLRTDHLLLASLQRPFVLMFPYQDRRTRSKYGTSTSGKRGTYFMNTKFWIHLPNGQHVQLKLQKSRIFGGPQSHSTIYDKLESDGRASPLSINKLDHCFYTGTVRPVGPVSQSGPNSYVAVDSCHGLRGLIHLENQTFGVLPLMCSTCQPSRLPHVVYPHRVNAIERDVKLPVFWQPTGVLSGGSLRLSKDGDQVHLVRLAVILDHQLFASFQGNLERSAHYIGSVVNQATKSFLGLPIELSLRRSEVWNLRDHIDLNQSIKTTLNNLAVYSIGSKQSVVLPTTHVNRSTSRDSLAASNWPPGRRNRRSALPPVSTSSGASSSSHSRPANQHDVVVLLTATQFNEAVEHLAVPDSICTPRSMAIVQVNMSETTYHVSRLVSLAVAEVMGLKSFPCPPRGGCSNREILSDGDKARIRLALISGMADCLVLKNELEAKRFHEDHCGNGRLDRGEECDRTVVTSADQPASFMPCCNPKTCLASVEAACTHGTCCHQCELVKRGRLCRSARDTCDVSEFCTGTHSTCPVDLYLENGTPCRSPGHGSGPTPQALCYQGHCPTRDSQCRAIWGPGATAAADYCFQVHNTRTAGACRVPGKNCPSEHAMCGLLHCQGGQARPITPAAQAGQAFLTYTEHKGQQFECKHLSDTSSVRFVPEAAGCAANRYCFNQNCVQPSVALRSQCPKGPDRISPPSEPTSTSVSSQYRENVTCSNLGLCTHVGFCLCPPGRTGSACERLITGPVLGRSNSPPSTIRRGLEYLHPAPDITAAIWKHMHLMQSSGSVEPTGDRHSSESQIHPLYLFAILGAVVGGMCIFFVIFLLFYRRRRRSVFPRKSNRPQCCSWSLRSGCLADSVSNHNNTNGKNGLTPGNSGVKLNGSLRRYNTSPTEDDVHTLSPPTTRSSTRNRLEADPNRSYLSKWAKEARRSGRYGKRRTEPHSEPSPEENRDPDYQDRHNRSRHHHHHRRRHRNNRLRHHQDDMEMERSRGARRRSGKHSGSGAEGSEHCRLLKELSHLSDTELACRQSCGFDTPTDSIDRMIKFGSMPSYKEDKVKQAKRRVTNAAGSAHSLNPRLESTPTHTPVTSHTVIADSLPSPVSSTRPGESTLHTSSTVNSAAILSPTGPSPFIPSSTTTVPLGDRGEPWILPCPLGTQPQVTVSGIVSTTALVEAGKVGAAALNNQVSSSPVCTSAVKNRSGENGVKEEAMENMNDVQFSIIMENSWRQPEKGILKNKNEGGSSIKNGHRTSSHRSGHGRHHGHRRHHHHGHNHHHHHHRRRSHTSKQENMDRRSECSDCSLCPPEVRVDTGVPDEVHLKPRSRHGSRCRRSGSVTAAVETEDGGGAPADLCSSSSSRSRSVSSSGLSVSTHSSSSSSSTSSSFPGLEGNAELSSSSTSTTSTCSTALEVGPNGIASRSGRRDGGEVEGDRIRSRRKSSSVSKCDRGQSEEPHRQDGESRRSCHGHRHRHHRHNHHHHHNGKPSNHRNQYGNKRRDVPSRHGSDSEVPVTSSGAGAVNVGVICSSSGTVGALESSESSQFGPMSGTMSGVSSGASSSSSGLAVGGTGRHMHRRHLRRRRRSEDETSLSRRSSPLPPAPTILCNAGQQTDELSLLKATGLTITSKRSGQSSRSSKSTSNHRDVDGSDAEWEEVECSESACEECQTARRQQQKLQQAEPHNPTRPSLEPPSTPAPYYTPPIAPLPFTVARETTLGHTNPAYIQTLRHSGGDANMSNPSIVYQQQSTASSSLGSSKNSRIGTPAMQLFSAQQQQQQHQPTMTHSPNNTQSPHGSASGVGSTNQRVGIAMRAASSSSCSSSSMATGQPGPLMRPNGVTGVLGKPTGSENEFANQHSETEVDAHLQQHIVAPLNLHPLAGNYYPVVNSTVANPASTSYPLPPRPLPAQMHRDGLFAGGHPNMGAPRIQQLTTESPNSRSHRQLLGPSAMGYTESHSGDGYYQHQHQHHQQQHPYEEVATDEYTETTGGMLRTMQLQPPNQYHHNHQQHQPQPPLQPQHHIYHQHGLPTSSATVGGTNGACALYTKPLEPETEEDDRLSLDEGHGGGNGLDHGIPTGIPALVGRYMDQGLSNYPQYVEPRIQPPNWSEMAFTGALNDHQRMGGYTLAHPSTKSGDMSMAYPTDSHLMGGGVNQAITDDAGSEFSLSAFRRDDIQLTCQPPTNRSTIGRNGTIGSRLAAPGVNGSLNMNGSRLSNGCAEAHSNDGTCDESDASSLPEAGCDLVQLAQLDVSSGRPNHLLSDLARQQSAGRHWMSPPMLGDPNSMHGTPIMPPVQFSATNGAQCQPYIISESLTSSGLSDRASMPSTEL